MSEALNVEKIFGEKVFTLEKMKERLTRKVFLEVKRVMEYGGELSMTTADVVAKAMKDWAVENGATHYTHWFQPLTGITADGIFRKRAHQRRTRCFIFSVGRTARNL